MLDHIQVDVPSYGGVSPLNGQSAKSFSSLAIIASVLPEQPGDEHRAVDYLDHDEALLATLYDAGGNPVLVDTIRSLWQRCRAYKIVGAAAAITVEGDSLWRYQRMLIDAAMAGDAAAAEAASRASLLDATERIRQTIAARQRQGMTGDELQRFAERTADLSDPEVMTAAWRGPTDLRIRPMAHVLCPLRETHPTTPPSNHN